MGSVQVFGTPDESDLIDIARNHRIATPAEMHRHVEVDLRPIDSI
jgi:hypothetical protein